MSFTEAACLPVAAGTSLYVLKLLGPVGKGKRLLVNGATGGVGTFMVPIGKLLGAHVTAVCHSRNVAFASELGADEVLPYDAGDFRGRGQWDVIVDVAGNAPFASCGKSLTPGGTWVTLTPGPGPILVGPIWGLFTGKHAKACFGARAPREIMTEVLQLVAQKKLRVHVTQTFPLAELAQAHAALERGTRGKIAVEVA
jgi:NADPH:quinone reductase-like Zn-dependent oxidoreductase